MQVFGADFLRGISVKSHQSERLRQHFNVHASYEDNCQKLFNAIQPGSYIRPHRHLIDPKNELLVAIKGRMALIIFDEQGQIKKKIFLGTENYKHVDAVAVELTPDLWHTVIALEKDSVLLEIKPGPFDPSRPKELAPWAPEEGSTEVENYMTALLKN